MATLRGNHKWIMLIVVWPAFFGLCASDDVKQMLADCCLGGEQLAERGGECAQFKPAANVSAELLSSCFFSSDICCSAKLRIEQCKLGVLAGKVGHDCYGNATAFYTSCCEACKIGLVIGATNAECALNTIEYGAPFDESYMFCCQEMSLSVIETEGVANDACSERPCSQLCQPTVDSYVCKCETGFGLLDDQKTCVPFNSTATSNEVHETLSADCPVGHVLNEDTDGCEDVNECETSDVECDMETQVCLNTEGSYKCLNIEENSEGSQCDSGLRYNAKTGECDDINECLEQTDNCDPSGQQLCLNTRGSFQCRDRTHATCMPGFELDDEFKRCQDIDECKGDHKCPMNTVCENIHGGFNCPPIRATRPSTSAVANPLLNAAASKRRPTSCAAGFRAHLNQCLDIDECKMERNICESNQICVNIPGGFECNCKIGYAMDSITEACVDINECQINNHDCLDSHRCDNTIGSYTCIRLQSCGTGYTLNAGTGTCDDDDECVLKRHNCVPPYQCRNTKGSFRCERPPPTTTPLPTTTAATTTTPRTTRRRAPPASPSTTTRRAYSTVWATTTPSYGPTVQQQQSWRYSSTTPYPYQPNRTPPSSYANANREYDRYLGPCNTGLERNENGACADIDECQSQPCRRNQRCINTNGSYRCVSRLTCSGGYQSNDEGTECVDIDECETNEARCSPGQTCTNKPGGYTCTCLAGHVYRNRQCEDIDECEFYRGQVCPVSAKCRNTIGSYRCDCLKGFRKNNDEDKVCSDVDECSEQFGLCQQSCVNMWGSYRCTCNNGYTLAADNRTCVDVDECTVHKQYDLCMGICENTPGSFQCACPPGYRLAADGRSCQDINECESGRICNGHNEICTNVQGSYRCTRIDCQPDYMRDPEKKNRCKRMSMSNGCNRNDMECFLRPSSVTYNFVTVVANSALPPQGRGFFTLRGPAYYDNIDFEFRIVDIRSGLSQQVDDRFFKLTKMDNEVLLSLMQSLDGPQDIEAELKMTPFKDGQPIGTIVQKIMVFVSEFSY